MKKYGFTLAEVLITLVIIGVIAAIIVPSIVINANNEATVSKLKKVHSTLQQATDMIMMEEGNAKASTGGWAKDVDAVYNQYKKHLNILKDCGSGTGCFPHVYYKRLDDVAVDDSYFWDDRDDMRKVVLSDGTLLLFEFKTEDCSTTSATGTYKACAKIWTDINGEKGPNKIGRDAFEFTIKENMLVPSGCDYWAGCGMFSNDQMSGGWGCACRVLRENAINY